MKFPTEIVAAEVKTDTFGLITAFVRRVLTALQP